MRRKIAKTIVTVFFTFVILAGLELLTYVSVQEYAKVSSEQVEDNTESYKILKTQKNVNILFRGLELISITGGLFLIGSIWFKKPKERKTKVKEKG